jgi:mRNA-degrading endonuclease HigB of HigAB toxin-antitoxin module
VRATDLGGLSVETALIIQVTDVNEAPTDVVLAPSAVADAAPAGTVVGQLTAADPDAGDVHTFELVAGEGDADNEAFEIVGQELRTVGVLDFATQSEYQVRVRATDLGGLSVEAALVVLVIGDNEAPTEVLLTSNVVAEDTPAGTVVGLLSADDANAGDVHTFELVAGDGDVDNEAFEIVGQELRTVATFDFETQNEYHIRVRATDLGGLSVETALVIQVTDVNEAPTDVALTPDTVAEDAPAGTVVGLLTALDPDADDVHTFELVVGEGDADNGAFEIVGQELRTVGALDYETQNEYHVRVRATDLGGLSVESELMVFVTNVNEPPVNFVPGTQSTLINQPLVFSAATGNAITVTDPDAGDDLLRVSLVAEGGTVNVDELFGSLEELNDLLDGLLFTPDEDFFGDAFLDIITDDLGHHGEGGPQTAVDRIMISVN